MNPRGKNCQGMPQHFSKLVTVDGLRAMGKTTETMHLLSAVGAPSPSHVSIIIACVSNMTDNANGPVHGCYQNRQRTTKRKRKLLKGRQAMKLLTIKIAVFIEEVR